jgi:hypothetical protein
MKVASKILAILFSAILIFSACSSDNKDNRSEHFFNGICKLDIPLKGFANQLTTTQETSVPLDTLLKDNDYIPPVTNGVMFLTNTTAIEITGLKEGIILKNFILNINDLEYKFGDITSSNTVLYTDQTMSYFKNVFDRMIAQNKLRASASFTPSQKIDETSDVKLKIVFGGKFSYWK